MWGEIWQTITDIPTQIFGVILIFLLAFLIVKIIGRLVAIFLNKIKLDQVFKRMGWEEALTKIHPQFTISRFFRKLVEWFFIILFLWIFCRIAGATQISQFLEKIIAYFPNIFIAVLIFVITVFLADFSQKIFIGTLKKEKITYSGFLGRIIRWTIWTLAALAILYQLKIVPTLILSIFIGLVGAIAIAVGIAFGLGGKEIAAKILKELEDKFG